MHKKLARNISFGFILLCSLAHTASGQVGGIFDHTLKVSVMDRTRVDTWQWFAAPPASNSYGYVQSLLRIAAEQRLHNWDWKLELSQPSILDAPENANGTGSGQGQLGLGSTYYAANANSFSAAAFLKQGFVRYSSEATNLRVGRFEFVDGTETSPADSTIAWLQSQRIAHRLIGNFGFSNAQRSFDGADLHLQAGSWNVTGFAARADQGVFNMNGNPELNVDVQYLALTRPEGKHLLWRAFALGYHDGRTGLTKTDNRSAAIRAVDHGNIRIGTYGGDVLASVPAGPGQFDLLFWGAVQNGKWGALDHKAGAAAVEGGYQLSKVPTNPWLRGGWFRSTGDENPADNTHNTFFQVLPTPRIYARLPFYNLMNSTDGFAQLMDTPVKQLALRSELHWLKLTAPNDLWYLGGGAFDNKVFGYVGRPSQGSASFASVADVSADWHAARDFDLNFYYAFAQGKSLVQAIYPTGRNMQYGYVECVYHWRSGNSGSSLK
jgi:Alginate export